MNSVNAVVLLDRNQYEELYLADLYDSGYNYVDYDITTLNEYEYNDYWYVEVNISGDGDKKELIYHLYKEIDYIAIRIEHSNFIVASDEQDFLKGVDSLFFEDELDCFIYNMMTVSERYDALIASSNGTIRDLDELRLFTDYNGSLVSTILTDSNPGLFKFEPIYEVVNEYTGEILKIDCTDKMLNNNKISLAILK